MSDTNFPPGEFADQDRISVSDIVLAPPNLGSSLDDIFKLSHVTNSTFERITVVAGAQIENALDMNRMCCGNTFKQLKLDAGKECAILCKGGSCDNSWDDVELTRAGGHSDIFIGDFSDQSKASSVNNRFNNVRRKDGQPVRVRWTFFRARKPIITNSQVTYQYGWSLISTVYVETKYRFPKFVAYLESKFGS